MNKEEKNFSLGIGAVKDSRDNRDYRLCSVQAPVGLPLDFLLEDKFTCKNQFSRGSCTSQAQSHHKERQEGIKIGARPIMAWTKELEKNKEYGAMTRNTFKIVNSIGCCNEEYCPEPNSAMSWEEYIDVKNIPSKCTRIAIKHKSKSYWRINNSPESINQAIFQNKNSVVISMGWYREFNRPNKDGILPAFKRENFIGGHAVEVEGFNNTKTHLIVKNSWGNGWGLNGRFMLPYEYFNDIVWDAWCSLDLPQEMPVDLRYDIKRTWASYMREKRIAFNPWLKMKIKRLPNNREINALAYGFWDFESVFLGRNGDMWLKITKPEAIKKNLIK